jgi:hypothetical protein
MAGITTSIVLRNTNVARQRLEILMKWDLAGDGPALGSSGHSNEPSDSINF